jgi:hypothetical protein
MRRIIIDDWTPMSVFVLSLDMIMFFVLDISCDDSEMNTMASAMQTSALVLPLFNTGPVSILVILGKNNPTPEKAREASMIMKMSLNDRQLCMYSSRSPMPSFFWGRGR